MFTEKITTNLETASRSNKDHERIRLVNLTLEVFNNYLTDNRTRDLITSIPSVKLLVKNHVNHFEIFEARSQIKQLEEFFRVLSAIWTCSDFVADYEMSLGQLDEKLDAILDPSQDPINRT